MANIVFFGEKKNVQVTLEKQRKQIFTNYKKNVKKKIFSYQEIDRHHTIFFKEFSHQNPKPELVLLLPSITFFTLLPCCKSKSKSLSPCSLRCVRPTSW